MNEKQLRKEIASQINSILVIVEDKGYEIFDEPIPYQYKILRKECNPYLKKLNKELLLPYFKLTNTLVIFTYYILTKVLFYIYFTHWDYLLFFFSPIFIVIISYPVLYIIRRLINETIESKIVNRMKEVMSSMANK